eukprot:GFUD01056974.1.p1 GENE.GFUD01056974.1~~GFUD01056974.1.p1  ORF type:complete len:111 (+),score=42.19 GFUD01056974.1:66-398(+)
MADTERELAELKGGHAPAQKVGGVRLVNRTPTKSESDKNEKPANPSEEDVEEFGEDKENKKNTRVVVSGAKADEGEAFPKAAVQSYHEKPQPTFEKNHVQKPNIIQQPRK